MKTNELEMRLLGACMTGGPADVAKAVYLGITEQTFSDGRLAAVWHGLVDAATNDRRTDSFFVLRRAFGNEMTPVNRDLVAEISKTEPTTIYLQSLIDAVLGDYRRRAIKPMLRVAVESLDSADDWQDAWARASVVIREAQDIATKNHRASDLGAMIDEYIAEEMSGKPKGTVGTGVAQLDEGLGLLAPGEVLIVAGRPAVGKTALAIQMADSLVRAGKTAMIVSLEMSGRDLVGRIAKQRAGRAAAIARGCAKADYDKAKTTRVQTAEAMRKDVGKLHIFEVNETSTVSRIEDRVAMLASAGSLPDVVVIDYLQLIQPEDGKASREQQVASMSRRLKLMALSFKVPVILLSQLNRDSEKNDRRPRMSDLRESGSIEQDADRVWLLYPDPESPVAPDSPTIAVMIEQAKNRNGQSGVRQVANFFRPTFSFEKP